MHMLTGKWDKNRGNTLQTRGERTVHVHTYALEREDHPAVAVGHLSFSLLCSLPSFEAPGIFPGSLLQPVYSRQRAGGRGSSAKQDFVLIPSFFPPHSYRRAPSPRRGWVVRPA